VREVLRGPVWAAVTNPWIYFRALLIGYFEGIGAERGIAWRLADSLALRRFVGIGLDEYTPDHFPRFRERGGSSIWTRMEKYSVGCWGCWRIAGS
jgi:hypothetical protein